MAQDGDVEWWWEQGRNLRSGTRAQVAGGPVGCIDESVFCLESCGRVMWVWCKRVAVLETPSQGGEEERL